MSEFKNLVIIPGYGPNHPDRFQWDEQEYAKDQGMHVEYPQDIPGFDGHGEIPTYEVGKEYIVDMFRRLGLEPDRTAILPHSLGGMLWLRIFEEMEELRTAYTGVIGTPLKNNVGEGYEWVDDFLLQSHIHSRPFPEYSEETPITVIGSEYDPVIHETPNALSNHVRGRTELVMGAGHFMPRALQKGPFFNADFGPKWSEVRGLFKESGVLPY